MTIVLAAVAPRRTLASHSFHWLTRLLLTRSLTTATVKGSSYTSPLVSRASFSRRLAFVPGGQPYLFATSRAESSKSLESSTAESTTPVGETVDQMFPNFADVPNLHPVLKRNVATMKFQSMTEIQAKTYETASSGRDVLGRARTGTGKTVAFLLPSLQQLLVQSNEGLNANVIHMLILSPTRELAAQIDNQAQQLCAGSKVISHQVMFGGASKPKDISSLERRIPTVLVATPGRLRDHLQTTTIRGQSFAQIISQTSILVLDETDRLLDMGFRRDVEDIISYLPDKQHRQTLLFSATVPPEVKAIMAATMRSDFATVDCIHDTDPASHTNKQVDQSHVIVPSTTRLVTGTVDIVCKLIADTKAAGEVLKLVVFFNTAHLVSFYAALFNDGLNIPVMELHSRKSQSFRTRTADAFRAATEAILFTSDVSARGVDYPGVTDVVQFGIPDSRESYIHRLGRTGRAGKQGEGLLVLTELERKFLNQLSGLDVAENKSYQALIDAGPSAEVMPRLAPILVAIGDGSNSALASDAKSAYRSMLGFYNGKLAKLGVPGTDRLVGFVNDFSRQTGLTELPEIETKTIKKMGLVGASGLNIVKNASMPSKSAPSGGGQGNGGRGGGNGGRGGGGNGGGGRGGRGDQGPRQGGGGRGGRGSGRGSRGAGGNNPTFRETTDGGARRPMSTTADGATPASPTAKRHSPTGLHTELGSKRPKQEGEGAPKSNNNRRRNRRPAGPKDSQAS